MPRCVIYLTFVLVIASCGWGEGPKVEVSSYNIEYFDQGYNSTLKENAIGFGVTISPVGAKYS